MRWNPEVDITLLPHLCLSSLSTLARQQQETPAAGREAGDGGGAWWRDFTFSDAARTSDGVTQHQLLSGILCSRRNHTSILRDFRADYASILRYHQTKLRSISDNAKPDCVRSRINIQDRSIGLDENHPVVRFSAIDWGQMVESDALMFLELANNLSSV
nr:hypothetical protein Iba_chr05aCG14940 [Ipomoea batatas]